MNEYLKPLIDTLEAHANPDKAGPMARYLRDQFPFLGIQTPERRTLLKNFIALHGLPPLSDLEEIVRDLWERPQREYQYVAVALIGRRQRQLTPDHMPLLEYLVISKSWWDTVDGLATNIVGPLFARYPETRELYVARWRSAENIWLRRTALLFQLKYKDRTDEALLYELIQENLISKEFFIQKAIGWALREHSKRSPVSVQAFVANTPDLPPLSRREALKWMKNKGILEE